MDSNVQATTPRRKRANLSPWEKSLRRIWPALRLFLLGAIGICTIILIISLIIAAI